MNPFTIGTPTLVSDLKALRKSDTKMTAEGFAKAANELLGKRGLPFNFVIDTKTCEKIESAWAARKPTDPPLTMSVSLQSVDGERASLRLPEPGKTGDCIKCFVSLPALEVTSVDFVTLIDGRSIKFQQPANFLVDEATLLDTANFTSVKKRWRIPHRGLPLGVSYDENVLYVAFSDPDLKDLAIAIFGEGTFEITTRADAESSGPAEPVPDNKGATPMTDVTSFTYRDKKLVVRYPKPCL
jgi:hypothetical protein